MPMPMTRPMIRTLVVLQPTPLWRPHSPGIALPPSNGTRLPSGAGRAHVVADPGKVVRPPAHRTHAGQTQYRYGGQ